MRKLVTFLMILLASVAVINAQQNPFMNDANGRPLYWGANYVPDGTPYFHEQYNWADITTLKGTVYKDVRVKYNLLDRVVQSHPEVEIGSYPKWRDPMYKTKVTLDSTREDAMQAALELLLSLLPPGEPQRIE